MERLRKRRQWSCIGAKSTLFSNAQYSFNSRFAEGWGTNPEELVAAAHAGCFSMKLTFVLGAAGLLQIRLKRNVSLLYRLSREQLPIHI